MVIKITGILISALVGGIVGFISTIVVQNIQRRKRRKEIKGTVNIILTKTILESVDKFEKEVEIVKRSLDSYSHPDVVLNLHPELTSYYLKSFDFSELGYAYGDKFHHLVDVMAILDYLTDRIPLKRQNAWVERTEQHLHDHFEDEKHKWKTKEDHFIECPEIERLRGREKRNLDLSVDAINELREGINNLVH